MSEVITTQEATTKRGPGRPIVEGSKRQAILADKATRREAGTLRKGRPVNPNSKAAQRRALKARKAELGINKPGYNKAKLAKLGIDPSTVVVEGNGN